MKLNKQTDIIFEGFGKKEECRIECGKFGNNILTRLKMNKRIYELWKKIPTSNNYDGINLNKKSCCTSQSRMQTFMS